jgi:hypothetical protein
MKKIYEFEVSKDNFIDQEVVKQDAEGKDIRVLEKVNKPITKTYFIAKPTFSIRQSANLYFEGVVAECIKRGIFSSIQLRKRFVDDGGILSQEEQKKHNNLLEQFWVKKSELNKLNEDIIINKEKIEKITEEIDQILSELQVIEEKSGNHLVGQHTAEKIASDRTVIWLTIYLSYQDLGNNKYEPVFGNGTEEDRFKKYEDIDSNEDSFEFELVQKLLLATTLWYFGKAVKQEDFDKILKQGAAKDIFKQPKE